MKRYVTSGKPRFRTGSIIQVREVRVTPRDRTSWKAGGSDPMGDRLSPAEVGAIYTEARRRANRARAARGPVGVGSQSAPKLRVMRSDTARASLADQQARREQERKLVATIRMAEVD